MKQWVKKHDRYELLFNDAAIECLPSKSLKIIIHHKGNVKNFQVVIEFYYINTLYVRKNPFEYVN